MSSRPCTRCKDSEENVVLGYCESCRRHLAMLLGIILKLDGPTWDEYGVQVDWRDVERLYGEMENDADMHVKRLTCTLTALDFFKLEAIPA